MILEAFPSGPFETNAYIVGCTQTHDAALIDPGVDSADTLIQALDSHSLTPKAILLTHSHWDHTADVATLKKKFDIPIYIHPLDAPNLISPGADGLPLYISIEGIEPTHHLEEGQEIIIGTLHWHVIHTPGHSPGGVCFYCKEEQTLLSGDTLFQGSIGNLSFPTSDPDQMWISLKKLEKLPPETKVYPGHGNPTTIGAESWLPDAQRLFTKG